MVTLNHGSIATSLLSRIDNVPIAISGTVLLEIIDQRRFFVENATGLSVGSPGIQERFQPVIFDLATADLLRNMNLTGADANSISLGPLSISKGGETNLIRSAKDFEEQGMEKLRRLGARFDHAQTL